MIDVDDVAPAGRTMPWDDQGTALSGEVASADEALEQAGLAGWGLTKAPIYARASSQDEADRRKLVLVPGKYAVVRATDGVPLGVVGAAYRVVSNEEAFEWADALAGAHGFGYRRAGQTTGGARVWMLMETPFRIVFPDGTTAQQYLLLWNRHDGSGAVRAVITNIRISCLNKLPLALKRATASVSIRHTVSAEDKLAEAGRVLGRAQTAAEDAGLIARELISRKFSDRDWQRLVDKLVPVPATAEAGSAATARAEEKIATLNRLYYGPEGAEIVGTTWGALNAMAAWDSHHSIARNTSKHSEGENLFLRRVDGVGLADRALPLLLGRAA